MPSTTAKGITVPLGTDDNDAVTYITNVANALDAWPGTAIMDTTTRNALSGATRWTGRVIWNTTTTQLEVWNGSAWLPVPAGANLTYTPQIDQGVTNISKTVNQAAYTVHGNTVSYWLNLTMTAGGTASNLLTITLPITSGVMGTNAVIGQGYIFPSGGNGHYFTAEYNGSGKLDLHTILAANSGFVTNAGVGFGLAPITAIASGDRIVVSGQYLI